MALSLATMLPLVYAIKKLAAGGGRTAVGGAAVLGLVAGTVFVRRQLRRPVPLLDLTLFRSRVVRAAIGANLLSIGAFGGLLLIGSQYLQLVLGASPLEAGLVLVPGLAAAVVAGLLAVPLARRVPVRLLVVVGLLLGAAGFAVVTQLGTGTAVTTVVLAFVLVAAGAAWPRR